MIDDHLIQDLTTLPCREAEIETLQRAGVFTYSRLMSLIDDNTTPLDLRAELCFVLGSLYRFVDKRKSARPVLAALRSNEPKMVMAALHAALLLGLKRTVPDLIKLATDRQQAFRIRTDAIVALSSIEDGRGWAALKAMLVDETENIGVRAEVLQQSNCYADQSWILDYVRWLKDDHSDLRFWAAYCLGQLRYQCDISPALEALDHVTAYDHTLPTYWEWHVDREALFPLEMIYYHRLNPDVEGFPYTAWVISPAPEYDTFERQYRHWTDSWVYLTDSVPEVSLRIDSNWLIACLRNRWPNTAFDVRRPAPESYTMNFQLVLDGGTLIGGLHRDGYTLVVTGPKPSVFEFAAWYRSLFGPNQLLFLYEWAYAGIELTRGIAAQEVDNAIALRDQNQSVTCKVS